MASNQPLYKTPAGGFKKRRLQNSCDNCKQKKIKCDSAEQASNICSHCITFNLECTHRLAEARATRRAGKSTEEKISTQSSQSHTASTEPLPSVQLERNEIEEAKVHISAILSTTSPYELAQDHAATLKILVQISAYARHLETQLTQATDSASSPHSYSSSPEPENLPRPIPFLCDLPKFKEEEEELERDTPLSAPLRQLHFNNTDAKDTYYGKGSNVMLLKTAFNIKAASSGQELADNSSTSPKRQEYWSYFPFQRPIHEPITPPLKLPEVDLIFHLVALYFEKFQISFKMLHRPSFERSVFEGLYIRNRAFGILLLTVCGIAARYSDDPRVFIEGQGELSAGWKWINQLRPFEILSWDVGTEPSVYELQALCNYIMFVQTTTSGDLTWPLVALGLRYAHVVGAHRARYMEKKSLIDQELWKRAFWVLISIDTYSSAFYGRPRCTTPIDYNQRFPLEVDDEYWEHPDPEQCFKQPTGKISTHTFWHQLLKILRVLGIAQRSYLSLNSHGLEGHIWGVPEDEKVITELDSLLNVFVDGLPEHLRWNSNRDQPDSVFFNQSATLHSIYYWVKIQIHRPFISVPGTNNKSPRLSYSSLAVCSNAARSCIRLLDVQAQKGTVDWTTGQMSLYSSAMVLTLNLWGNSRLGLSIDPATHLEDLHRCISVLKRFEKRWQKAGGIIDIITGILSITDLPITRIPSKKRSRSEDDHRMQRNTSQWTTREPGVGLESSWSTPASGVSSSASAGDGASDSSWVYGELPLYTEDLSSPGFYFDTVQGPHTYSDDFRQGQFQGMEGGMSNWVNQTQDPAVARDFGESMDYASLPQNSNSADVWAQAVGGDPWEDWTRYFGSNS